MHPGKLILPLLLAAGVLGATPAVVDNPPLLTLPGEVWTLRAADVDADTKLDLVAIVVNPGSASTRISVLRGNGDGTFQPPVYTPVNQGVGALDVALLDGDAIPDLVTLSRGNLSELRVFRGLGDGTFAATSTEIYSSACTSRSISLADMTGDGRADIVCDLAVFPNLGGTFGSGSERYVGTNERSYVVDANADGKRDVVIDSSGSTSTLYLGNGNGTFQNEIYLDGNDAGLSAMADFDGSGLADVAFIDESLFLRLSAGGGTYAPRTRHGFAQAQAITTADLNGDGRPDLIAGGSQLVSVWIMGPGGVPAARTVYAGGTGATMLATGDFDRDGAVDVATAGGNFMARDTIAVLHGAGDGTLRAMRAYGVSGQWEDGRNYGGRPTSAAVSDVTGDGRPDLVTVATQTPAIAVFAGRLDGTFEDVAQYTDIEGNVWPAAFFADLDGDGQIDVLTHDSSNVLVRAFLSNGDGTYLQTAELPAAGLYAIGDFNGDGNVDLVGSYDWPWLRAGRGDGTFDEPAGINDTGLFWGGVLAGDVNGDGRDDLVFSSTILFGSASGAFTRVPYGPAAPVALADLDEDGKLDLINSSGTGLTEGITSVMRGNGDGTFAPQRTLRHPPAGFVSSRPYRTGDFNGDGHVDLWGGSILLLGDGAGFFSGFARVRGLVDLAPISVGDADGNGSDDLIVGDSDGYAHAVTVVRTRTAESQGLPLSLTLELPYVSFPAASTFGVTARSTGETTIRPTGAVVLAVGGVVSAMAELVNGVAQSSVVGMVMGSQPVTARFTGDDVYAGAEAAPRAIEITRAQTSFSVTRTPPGQVITTLDAVFVRGTVNSNLPGVTGTVTLYVDDVAREPQAAPAFTFPIGTLPVGRHRVRLEYSGDATHLPNVPSGPFSIFDVVKPEIAMTVTANPSGGASYGTPITVTVTFPNEPELTGTVNILGADGFSVPAAISGGVATLTTTALPPGQSIGASFPGNDKYTATTKWIFYTITDVPQAPGPSSLYLVTPCRVLDTRDQAFNAIQSGAERVVSVARRCGIPSGAKAVAVNVVAVNPQNHGYLTLFPAASPRPGTSTMNYRLRKTRANNAVLPLSAGGMLKIYNSGPTPIEVVLDVTGYFQ